MHTYRRTKRELFIKARTAFLHLNWASNVVDHRNRLSIARFQFLTRVYIKVSRTRFIRHSHHYEIIFTRQLKPLLQKPLHCPLSNTTSTLRKCNSSTSPCSLLLSQLLSEVQSPMLRSMSKSCYLIYADNLIVSSLVSPNLLLDVAARGATHVRQIDRRNIFWY